MHMIFLNGHHFIFLSQVLIDFGLSKHYDIEDRLTHRGLPHTFALTYIHVHTRTFIDTYILSYK